MSTAARLGRMVPRQVHIVSWLNCSRCVCSHTGSSTLVGQASHAYPRFRLPKIQISYFCSSGCANPRYRICTSSSADFSIALCGDRHSGSANSVLLHPGAASILPDTLYNSTRKSPIRYQNHAVSTMLEVTRVARTHYPLLEPNNPAFRNSHIVHCRCLPALGRLRQCELGKYRNTPTPEEPSGLQQSSSATFQDIAGKAGG